VKANQQSSRIASLLAAKGEHELPALPYALDGLAPHISARTLDYHHGKHHAGYVKKLNDGVKGTDFATMPLARVLQAAQGDLYNNAAQHFNHSLYWECLSPDGGGEPDGALRERIDATFGSFDKFREQFSEAATTHFGSGWAWLVEDRQKNLLIVSTSDADCPVTSGFRPLLTCDVWEHAYYLDRQHDRPTYVEAFWELVNWDRVSGLFSDLTIEDPAAWLRRSDS
jgi:Fe-Mn family superoxide dismutase